MKLFRSTLGASFILASVALSSGTPAVSQSVNMMLAHHFPTTHVQGKGYEFFVARVQELSGGRISAKSFPAGSLISGHESFEAVRTGSVQASNMVASFQTGEIPELDVFSLPFQFTDAGHFRRTLDAGLFDIIAAQYEAHGIHLLNYFNKGNIHVFHTEKALMSSGDFAGEDIRGLGGLLTRTLEQLDANAITMPPGEVNAALQRGVVKGVMTSCQGHISRGWSEEAKYVSFLNLAQSGEGLGVNKAWWDSLPDDLKAVVQQAADEMEDMEWSLMDEADNETCSKVWAEQQLVVARPTDEQRADLRAKVQPIYDEAGGKYSVFGAVMAIVDAER